MTINCKQREIRYIQNYKTLEIQVYAMFRDTYVSTCVVHELQTD